MLGVYDVYVLMLMYCECYVNFFIVLKLVSYDDENVWMMLYNMMKNCEYVVYDDIQEFIILVACICGGFKSHANLLRQYMHLR